MRRGWCRGVPCPRRSASPNANPSRIRTSPFRNERRRVIAKAASAAASTRPPTRSAVQLVREERSGGGGEIHGSGQDRCASAWLDGPARQMYCQSHGRARRTQVWGCDADRVLGHGRHGRGRVRRGGRKCGKAPREVIHAGWRTEPVGGAVRCTNDDTPRRRRVLREPPKTTPSSRVRLASPRSPRRFRPAKARAGTRTASAPKAKR